MDNLEQFLQAAQNIFGLFRNNREAPYIEVPCLVSENQLSGGQDDKNADGSCLTNPLIFLTGIRKPELTFYSGQSVAKTPSISLVTGQYGLGKTELLSQICYHVRNQENAPRPLPISLAGCLENLAQFKADSTSHSFIDLLFRHILNRTSLDHHFVVKQLLPEIHQGNVLLILDGLDELICSVNHSESVTQHQNFFKELMRLLKSKDPSKKFSRFKVVISLRLEYLIAIDNIEQSYLVDTIYKSKLESSVYFLKMEFFKEQRIKEFIGKYTGRDALFEEVKNNPQLLEILRRPLLLKIFCELANDRSEDIERWLEIKHVGELFDEYIKHASAEMTHDQIQKALSPSVQWNIDKLAMKSLDLLQEGREDLELSDIHDFVDELKPDVIQKGKHKPLSLDVLMSIHKLPFLRWSVDSRRPEHEALRIRFAHRAFQEFFTAKGMKLELDQSEHQGDHLVSFDRLVINVDMRKFLKYLVGEDRWYRRTEFSYGLTKQEQWEDQTLDFEELKRHRKNLLDLMTDPDQVSDEMKSSIQWFMTFQQRKLHPCYLMYNYEAVAVYLGYYWWRKEVRDLSRDFSEILEERLSETLKELRQETVRLADLKELLVERILSIGQRLRYEWVQEYSQSEALVTSIREPMTKKRVQATLEQVKVALF